MFTISEGNLDKAIGYVIGQKEHHAAGTIIERLERTSVHDDGPHPRPR